MIRICQLRPLRDAAQGRLALGFSPARFFRLTSVHAPAEVLVEGRGVRNIRPSSVTPDVPRADVLVKGRGAENIRCIDVTPEVSHAPMSSLKDAAAEL